MPWRMLLFLAVLVVVVVLFAVNMENRGSISFIFTRLDEVPIFMAVLVAFIAGATAMLPFTTGRRRKKSRPINKKSSEDPSALGEGETTPSMTPPIGEPLVTPSSRTTDRRQKPRRRRRVKKS